MKNFRKPESGRLMHLLLVAYYTPPVTGGGSRRPIRIADHLREKGHTVTILTATHDGTDTITPGRNIRIHDPGHNLNRKGLYRLLFWSRRILIELLNHLGIYASIYGGWRARVKKNARRIMNAVQPDSVLATYPPVEDLEIGLFFSESFHIPLLADFRDGLLFEPVESTRLSHFRVIQKRYRTLEEQVTENATRILTASHPITRYFQNRTQVPVHTLLNGFPEPVVSGSKKHFPTGGENSPFRIIHTGRFGLSDAGIDIRPFFDCVRQIIRRHPTLTRLLQIHLVGSLSSREYRQVKDLAEAGIMTVHGPVSSLKAREYQASGDLLLTITSTGRTSVVSTKFLEYLGMEAPILALTTGTEQERILKETQRGWTCSPDSREKIIRLLEKIILDAGFRRSLSPEAEKVRKYSWEHQVEILDTLFP
jgi:glycosyltransferase involved in cell wall biosynthesis